MTTTPTDDLPPLPEPDMWIPHSITELSASYTADQMRAYALADRQARAAQAEPVATLHDDGCFTWKRDEYRLKYDRQRAGWRMDVYATPPAQPMTSGEMNVLANTHGFARGDAALLNLMRDVEERCGVTGGRRYTNTDGSVTPLNATPAPQEPAAEPDHELKTWPPFFEEVLSGRKTFEVRKNDRGFAVGHVVRLNEWAPDKGYTGRFVDKRITYMLTGPQFGIEAGYSVLALYASPAPGELGAVDAAVGWISVADRMPEPDSGEVLVWLTGGRCAFDEWHMHREDPTGMSTTYTMEMGLMWRDYEFEDITHWMPLPQPPQQAPSSAQGSGGEKA